ncbi:MAG: type II asparaginase [Neisseriaceae bacterium]|nr:MAG: type II asparaginase [Neisseriaceae bacterium]
MHKTLITTLLCLSSFASLADNINNPTIEILATGGTIAGVASSQTSSSYKAGKLTAEQLISSVNGLSNLANIKYEQVYNKDSGDVTLNDWLKLYGEVQKAAENPSINAIVITHGTDTLDETAYFLELTAKTTKPIVLVGAMRPATSMSADGPLNLYNAVAVAANKDSTGRGVMVAMNEKIFDGREVYKTNTTSVDTFEAPNDGPIGTVFMGKVEYKSKTVRPNTVNTPFNLNGVTSLPDVAIIYEHVGVNTEMLDHILDTKNLKGIIIAGVGDGNIPSYEKDFLTKARKKGIVIVRSSHVGSGHVTYDYNNLDTTYGLVSGDDLSPSKARILLMLSLMKTSDIKQIQEYFDKY